MKSVLMSIQMFWFFIFILPSMVHKEIESKLRVFLWSGVDLDCHKAKVVWEEMCTHCHEDGFGLMRTKEWNKATMVHHIQNLSFANNNLIQVTWAKSNLLKNNSIWERKIPQNCFWARRSILKLRKDVKDYITFEVGDGENISLWYTNWNPKGPFVERYDIEIIYDLDLSKEAKVNDTILNGAWTQPLTFSMKHLEIKSSRLPKPNGVGDKVVQKANKFGKFSIGST